MRKGIVLFFLVIFILINYCLAVEEKAPAQPGNFFESSLHYTSRGMGYWYNKEQGGLEKITEIPYSELNCKNCHISTCDTCHKKTSANISYYSAEAGREQEKCLQCHAREAMIIMNIDKQNNTLDVHFEKGMQCMDCHTKKEIHGDGNAYDSMKTAGAMEVKCNTCHERVESHLSHIVHGNRLDCSACHVRHVATCYNCHFDTFLKENKRVMIPLSNWVFLMNYDGKVTSANMQTFVYQNKTFVVFAPMFSHSVMKQGRDCAECHNTEIIKAIKKKKFYPIEYKEGKVNNIKGVIPVIENMDWNFLFFNYINGEWALIGSPGKTLIQYAGYGTPLTEEQLKRLEKAPAINK
jgi:hypothetical protein